ncbi:MAG: hypothetical protein AAGI54_03645 [Planctomycetota bacterium]
MASPPPTPEPNDPLEQQLDDLLEQLEQAEADEQADDATPAPDDPATAPTVGQAPVPATDPPDEPSPDATATEDDLAVEDDAAADALVNELVDEQIEQAIAEVEQAVQAVPPPTAPVEDEPAEADEDVAPTSTEATGSLGDQLDQLFAAAPAPSPTPTRYPPPPPAEPTQPPADPAAEAALSAQLDALLNRAEPVEDADAIEAQANAPESSDRREVSIEDIDSLLADEAPHAAGPEFQPVEDVLADQPPAASTAEASPADTDTDASPLDDEPDAADFTAPEDVLAEPDDPAPTAVDEDDPAADFAAPDELDDEPARTPAHAATAVDEDDPDTPAPGRFARYLHAADRALGPAAYAATHAGPHVRRALATVNAPAQKLPREMRDTLGYVAIALAGPGTILFLYGLLT